MRKFSILFALFVALIVGLVMISTGLRSRELALMTTQMTAQAAAETRGPAPAATATPPVEQRTDAPDVPDAAEVNGPRLTVQVDKDRHAISPNIYGMSYGPELLVAELGLPVQRWGGNATTRYNWKLDTANRAGDWFFENIPNENAAPNDLPAGSETDRFVSFNRQAGTKTMLTVPLIGWTPKSREIACGFSVTKYGPQAQTDPWRPDCGNGVTLDGKLITGNDPTDTSVVVQPDFVAEWVAHLVAQFGTAADGGVAFYSLDNEPMLWHLTHRDVHPTPVGQAELRDQSYAYAQAIKQVDASAAVVGPALWGWSAYFRTALEQEQGSLALFGTAASELPFVARYLDDMQAFEQVNGLRILDYLDLHFYVQAPGVALAPAGDDATQALRLRSTRALWDPTYVDESWIGEPVYLIPRMRAWVDAHYPGTKLAVSEYNWGALDHINGALAQADVLGIFGREQLDMAMLWAPLDAAQPYAFAFRMYLNYDGDGNQFGDTSVSATSSDVEQVSIFAAQRSSDNAVTVLVINKRNEAITSLLRLDGGDFGAVESYLYSAEHPDTIRQGAGYSWDAQGFAVTLPPQSITLLVAPTAKTGSEQALKQYLPLLNN
jgi:hypothetical protein